MRDDLAVAMPQEMVALGEQLGAQLAVIVDFAVENHVHRAGFIGYRLVAGHQVDDGQTAHADPYAGGNVDTLTIRTAVAHDLAHGADQLPRGYCASGCNP